MRPSSIRRRLLPALALLALPAAVRAQGTLSTQGFGYPGGQMSTRALGAGGALTENDPFSATNPAAIFNFGGSILYFQAEPEYRTLTSPAGTDHATIARYPLVSAGVPIGSSFFAALTASNLLDRSFQTSERSTQSVSGQLVSGTNTFTSNGAIGDVRLALAWSPVSWLHLGAAGHLITGDNKLNSTQVFDDSAFATLVDTQTVTYSGSAYSAGFDMAAGSIATISGSYKHGNSLKIKHADTTFRQATVPDRISIGAAFIGVKGAAFGVRTSRDRWSNLAALGSSGLGITDAWDTSVGADVAGPRLFGSQLQVRAGARTRTLPFGTPGATLGSPSAPVKENSFSLGTGGGLSRGRASYDLALIRASRSAANTAVTEKAWTLSVGISVRP